MQFMGYNPTENDYKFWLVVNPSTWLIPTLLAVLVTAILIHFLAYSLPGQAYRAKPAVEAAAPAVEAAPAATPAN